MALDKAAEARIDAALEAKFPSTPLNHISRTINHLAELLPEGHECEAIFGQLDDLGKYVHDLERKVADAKDLVIYDDPEGEWSALYVCGKLDRVGDDYLIEERTYDLLGVTYIQDDAFMRGGSTRDAVAQTLEEIQEYIQVRGDKVAEVARLREQAAHLLEQAAYLEGS